MEMDAQVLVWLKLDMFVWVVVSLLEISALKIVEMARTIITSNVMTVIP